MDIQQHTARDTQRRSDNTTTASLGYFEWIMRVGILGIIGLGMTYLMMLNALATLGFDLENLKGENLTLNKELEKWDIEIAIPTSLYALESLESVQSMAPIERKTYLTVNGDEVAMAVTREDR